MAVHSEHPLDRPVYAALWSRQRDLAIGDDVARRFSPDFGPLAAAASPDTSDTKALAGLPIGEDGLWIVERAGPVVVPGRQVVRTAVCVQMTASEVPDIPTSFEVLPLSDAEAGEMFDLARLTKPGPFGRATHKLGMFIGVRKAGRLVAMAGERLQPSGFIEVSGVCTHPDARGQGYARALSALVARRILAKGEIPFLHAYDSNVAAIELYESLGFSIRCAVTVTILQATP